MKCVIHEAKRSQILLNTSSPGIALTLPERSSERRRLATAAHLRSMSNAGGFRLLRMESTTIVLSSTGREIASAIKSLVFKLVCLRIVLAHNYFKSCCLVVTRTTFFHCRTCESPAPKANDDLAKATFCTEIVKEKNAQAFGVRCTGWFGASRFFDILELCAKG